uniref:Suppressor of cytokine signaling 7 n=2 Tax=Gasterosteus aculeatus TaxID=69293 RepID=A0AAQ4NT10_GASAC|nr:suppressor of cytokine signaling 7 isoform X1 [Gasterosteus aculeatus aculeatus]XP_040045724.1 suppressor of cytokine signaling 7 isoform X1 [Gasterosteus aculeatus aculeatus]
MNDAGQEMSPDFVFMRLVSAAEYDRLLQPDHRMSGSGGRGPVKAAAGRFERGPSGPPPDLGSASPRYSSPLPGKGELAGGLVMTQASQSPEDFAVAAQRFVDYPVHPGSGGQLMVFKNLLRFGDQIPETQGERPHLDSGSAAGSTTAGPGPGGGKDRSFYCVPSAEENLQPPVLQWHPVLGLSKGSPTSQLDDLAMDPESGAVLRHRLAKWPPGLLKPSRDYCSGEDDPVLTVARRLDQLGEGAEEGGGLAGETALPLSQCSCHSFLSGRSGVTGPSENPSETSDALLVLEGLDFEGPGGGGDSWKGDRVGGVLGGDGPVFSSGTLSGLMQQVHRLAQEAGLCTNQHCQSSLVNLGATVPTPCNADSHPSIRYQSSSQSCATTPKLGGALGVTGWPSSPLVVLEEGFGGEEQTQQRKSKKGGSLKARLSKLFRTRSSGGGGDRRPSLASSNSSGGSLLDVWGSISSNKESDGSRLQISKPHRDFTPAFTGDTVSLVDVDISWKGLSFVHPPTSLRPPRRSLSLLDDFGGPLTGVSMQSLPPLPVDLPPSLSSIQHSLSLNDTFMRALPRLVPQRPGTPPRLGAPCPLGPPDSFASSLRELEKWGWYWGPMNWEDAELKLRGKPDGSFLVRDSSDPKYILSLSFRSQKVTHHTRMEHYRGTFSLWCHPKLEDRCLSVVEFIERAIMYSKNGKFLYFLRSRVPGLPPTPVQLLYPVSRFSSVKTLQHLCRFCIRQLVRIDHIQELPMPMPLIAYLGKFYYYDSEEEVSPSLKERGLETQGCLVQQVQPVVQPVHHGLHSNT